MGELGAGFAGNCLKGGRGLVVFDRSFDEQGPDMGAPGSEYRALVREMLRGVFCVPKRGVRGMKPFIDRIIGIFGVDGKIWIRVYEIRESEAGKKKDGDESTKPVPKGKDNSVPEVSLVEIGPRFVLTPIVILEGSFGGPVIYENKEYVSPTKSVATSDGARPVVTPSAETARLIGWPSAPIWDCPRTPCRRWMRWIQGSCLHRGFMFLFRRAISRLDIPRDDVSTTCVYLMRRFHHGPLRRRGKVSSWLISKS
ncbi:unnamed protein product [Penicillium nalgiovense]|nr:unnamed protein product [Penicillium nalgiovense]